MDKNKRLTPICIVYVDGERLGPAWEGRFRSIRVVDRLSGISGCAIVFSGDNSGKMDTEIFSVGSTISVYMGYKDDMRETFNGEVATFASTLPEAGGSSKLVVTAASYLGQLDRNEQSRVFENLSPSRIIQKILSEYGLQADCESFGPVKERLKEEGMSDWKFILELARRYGRNIYCFGKNVYVKAHMTMHKDEHIYEWGKSLIGLDVTMGDIGKATGVQVISHDQITGEDFVGECKLEDVKLKIGGTNDWRSVYAGVVRQSIRTVIDPSVIDRTEAEEVAEALMREMSFDFIKGNGEAEGDAGLKAGAVVTIKYAGLRYDGEYIAEEVEHKLSMREGYTTEFDIRRNMIGDEAVEALGGSRAVGPSHAPPPREKPESEQITVYEEEKTEEDHEPLLKEILSVACCDKDGNETTTCSEGQPLTLEASVNASVEEEAEVTFRVYREGDEPERDRLIETLTGVVRRGKARVELDPETVGRIIGGVFGGLAGGTAGARIGREIGERIGRFFVRASSEGCEEVQGEPVEIQVEEEEAEPMLANWPVASGEITSPWGRRAEPVRGAGEFHGGIDIAVPVGTQVFATSSGTVVQATYHVFTSPERTISYGNMIVIRMENGLTTAYLHLDRIDVAVNQDVVAGQQIGLSGNTGSSTGSHLHLSVWAEGVAIPNFTANHLMVPRETVNPTTVLPPMPARITIR